MGTVGLLPDIFCTPHRLSCAWFGIGSCRYYLFSRINGPAAVPNAWTMARVAHSARDSLNNLSWCGGNKSPKNLSGFVPVHFLEFQFLSFLHQTSFLEQMNTQGCPGDARNRLLSSSNKFRLRSDFLCPCALMGLAWLCEEPV